MITTRALLLTSTILSALALAQATRLATAEGPLRLAQQEPPEGKPGEKPPAAKQPPRPQTPKGQQPPAAKGQPGQAPPSGAQGQPPQPRVPAAKGQPGQAPPSGAQGQPPQPRTPAAKGQPGQPQPPAAQGQPPQPRVPAAKGPPGQPQPPAAQGQPPQPRTPAAKGQPGQPQPPAAQGQPGQPQRPAAAGQPPAQQPRPVTQSGSILSQPTGSQGQPLRRFEDVRAERREVREGDRTVIREPGRTIIIQGNRTIVRHNEGDRFHFGGREVAVDRRGNETTTIVERPDGTRIITVTDDDGRLIRRSRRGPDGREIIIIDNRENWQPGIGAGFYVDLPPPVISIPRERYIVEVERASPEMIYQTLMAPPVERIARRYSLDEVRFSQPLRERMPRIDIDTVTFESGSWEVTPDQIDRLAVISDAINRVITHNPSEVLLIEGHTDAVGSDVDNLSLSDRRAESVAMALTERFQVPAENLTTQGYGEQYLKVQTEAAERQNRRVTVRRITPLLTGQSQSTGQAR